MIRASIIFLFVILSVVAEAVPDSVGVVTRDGQTFIKHMVEKGENN
jgi:uncharacterized protein YqjF (DUF2071 family)